MRKGILKGSQVFKNERQIIKKTYQEALDEYMITAKIRGLADDTIKTYYYYYYYHHHKYFIEAINKGSFGNAVSVFYS